MNPITKSQIRPDEYFNFPKKSINSNSKFQNFFQKNWRMLEKMNPSPGIKKKKEKHERKKKKCWMYNAEWWWWWWK